MDPPTAPNEMREHYEKLYRQDERYWGTQPSPLSLLLLRHRKTGTLLDLGCGQGPDALFFARKGFSVTAIDISPTAISDLHRQSVGLLIKGIVGDMRQLPKGQYDVIFSRMALQMIKPEHRTQYLKELKTTYPDALHLHTVPINGACFGDEFICEDALLKNAYADWETVLYEECWSLSRITNKDNEPYLLREARIIARRLRT